MDGNKLSNKLGKIILIFILIIVMILLIIPVVKLTQKPEGLNNIFLEKANNKNFCQSSKIECQSDTDCDNKCVQDMEYTCQNIVTREGNSSVKSSKKYCLPKQPENFCNIKNGGIPVWTGWGDTNRMEWDCMCMFPNYFGGIGCEATPGVCEVNGVSFMKDRDYSKGSAPNKDDCSTRVTPDSPGGNPKLADLLGKGYNVNIRGDGTPIIIPVGNESFYNYQP